MSTILDEIISRKRQEVAIAKHLRPLEQIEEKLPDLPAPRGFISALRQAAQPALIAEVKKASPSAGLIREDFDPVLIAQQYQQAGASCLSVLTDEHYFQGHLRFLKDVAASVSIPVMRKEFIIDRHQIAEAREVGADCVLLIAECLDDHQLNDLYQYARSLSLDVLIELYEPENVPRVLATGTELLGVNNRNLRTFVTSLDHTFMIRKQIPESVLFVSESGIRTHEDLLRLREHNVGAVLVGESLMRQPDIGDAVRNLLQGS